MIRFAPHTTHPPAPIDRTIRAARGIAIALLISLAMWAGAAAAAWYALGGIG